MNAWKVILATLVIFGAGVVTGGLLVAHSERFRPVRVQRAVNTRPSQPGSTSPGGMRFEFLRRAQRELGLTAEQQARVDQILKQSQERTRGVLHEEIQKTKQEFREVLTPEQQARFDEMLKQQQRAREQRHSQSGRPHPTEAPTSSNAPGPVK